MSDEPDKYAEFRTTAPPAIEPSPLRQTLLNVLALCDEIEKIAILGDGDGGLTGVDLRNVRVITLAAKGLAVEVNGLLAERSSDFATKPSETAG